MNCYFFNGGKRLTEISSESGGCLKPFFLSTPNLEEMIQVDYIYDPGLRFEMA